MAAVALNYRMHSSPAKLGCSRVATLDREMDGSSMLLFGESNICPVPQANEEGPIPMMSFGQMFRSTLATAVGREKIELQYFPAWYYLYDSARKTVQKVDEG
jgi:hypothetical protein